MSGPPPKRSEERRRVNEPEVPIEKVNLDELINLEVEVPIAVETWEPLPKEFWRAFTRSGQAIWYEPTDWMTAFMLMEVLDRWLKPQEVKVGQEGSERDASGGGNVTYIFEDKIVAMPGGVLTAIIKGLTSLMATEGDRRKLRIELERRNAIDAALGGAVIPIAQTREDAFARARAAKQQQAE